MSQIPLIMPCLPCDPPCVWPVNGATDIRISVGQFFAQACVNCIELNKTYLPTFVSKSITPGNISCIYEDEFSPGTPCGVQLMRLNTSLTVPGGLTVLGAQLIDILGFQFARWAITLTPAEALTNGPFEMVPTSITFAICQQITLIPVIIRALP